MLIEISGKLKSGEDFNAFWLDGNIIDTPTNSLIEILRADAMAQGERLGHVLDGCPAYHSHITSFGCFRDLIDRILQVDYTVKTTESEEEGGRQYSGWMELPPEEL